MPLSGDVLALMVLAEVGGEITPERQAAFQSLCRAIITHIQQRAEVTVNVTGTATGVLPGPAAVPVVGVGTGKVL